MQTTATRSVHQSVKPSSAFIPKGAPASSDLREPDAIHLILEGAGRYKLLTPDEEIALSRDVQALLDAEANQWRHYSLDTSIRKAHQQTLLRGQRSKDRMICANLRLVVSIVKRYTDHAPFEDLFQEGCIGLKRAAEKFDASKGYKFSTYATQWILQGITRYLSEKTRTIRFPVHKVDKVRQICRFVSGYERQNFKKPSLEEIAEFMGLPCEDVVLLLNLPRAGSLDVKMQFNKDDARPLAESIPCPRDQPEDSTQRSQLKEGLEVALSVLTAKEQTIIKLRFGIDAPAPMTLVDIGKRFGVTRERIRQLEKKAMIKLAKSRKAKELKSFLAAA